jgi:N6-L-threonylcarbamoyladenine synthase
MNILAIETSCDETSCAIVKNGRKIISNIISSSQVLHQKSGGIIPENAAREQVKYIIPVIKEALEEYASKENLDSKKFVKSGQELINFIKENFSYLAVTVGPGLIGSLLVGVETAKTISAVTMLPLIPVNHIFAHIYANWLENPTVPEFPAIALVVSGGHTELYFFKNHGSLKWLGGTRDDAAGEAFDKTARLLNLGYPGGPAIAKEAEKYNYQKQLIQFNLPRPMIDSDNYEFSFSGLKTAILREVICLKNKHELDKKNIAALSFEIQEAITDVLITKTLKAANVYQAKSILLGGGVAANYRLMEKFNNSVNKFGQKIKLFIPPPKLCTDNAAYIASYAYFNPSPKDLKNIKALPNLEVEV